VWELVRANISDKYIRALKRRISWRLSFIERPFLVPRAQLTRFESIVLYVGNNLTRQTI